MMQIRIRKLTPHDQWSGEIQLSYHSTLFTNPVASPPSSTLPARCYSTEHVGVDGNDVIK